MAHTLAWYGMAFKTIFNKEVDIPDDAFKVALANTSYTPDIDAHDYFNDVTNELSGGGYTSGGHALVSPSWTQTGGSNLWTLDATDLSISSLSVTNMKYGIIYDSTPGTAATNPLIALITFDAAQTFTNATMTLQWNASGIVTITY